MRAKDLAFSPSSLGFCTAWWLGTRESQVEVVSPFMAKAQKPYSITPINFPVTGSESPKPVHTPGEENQTPPGWEACLRVCEHVLKSSPQTIPLVSTPMLTTNSDTSLFFGLPLPLSQSPRVVDSTTYKYLQIFSFSHHTTGPLHILNRSCYLHSFLL